MVKRKNGPATQKNVHVPAMSLREHAGVVAKDFFVDIQLRFESQLDALLERVGLVRKSQV